MLKKIFMVMALMVAMLAPCLATVPVPQLVTGTIMTQLVGPPNFVNGGACTFPSTVIVTRTVFNSCITHLGTCPGTTVYVLTLNDMATCLAAATSSVGVISISTTGTATYTAATTEGAAAHFSGFGYMTGPSCTFTLTDTGASASSTGTGLLSVSHATGGGTLSLSVSSGGGTCTFSGLGYSW